MRFIDTADCENEVRAIDAIINDISSDGGLYVPSSFPIIEGDFFARLIEEDAEERVSLLLSLFIDEVPFDVLEEIASDALDGGGDVDVVKVEEGLYLAETWHGDTCCGDDFASRLYVGLVGEALKAQSDGKKEAVAILCVDDDISFAKAFDQRENASALVFYSKAMGYASHQLLLNDCGENLYPVAVKAHVIDVGETLDGILKDVADDGDGYMLCKMSNVNVIRIIASMIRSICAYCDLVESEEIGFGDKINFATSSVEDALSLYYASKMGLPVNKIIVGANINNAFADFISTGEFSLNKQAYKTLSPRLDRVDVANTERLLFETLERDELLFNEKVECLRLNGEFSIDEPVPSIFEAGWADEEDTKDAISTFFDLDDYLMDTHTGVCASVYNDYSCETDDETVAVLLSSYNPCLFAKQTLAGIGIKEKDEKRAVWKLQNATAIECPDALADVPDADDVRVVEQSEMKDIVLRFLSRYKGE